MIEVIKNSEEVRMKCIEIKEECEG